MKPAPLDAELDRLLAGLCDNTLTTEETERLAARLAASEADRQVYLHYLDLQAVLAGETAFALATESLGQMAAVSPPVEQPGKARSPWAWGSLIATVAALLFLSFWLPSRWNQPTNSNPLLPAEVPVVPVAWARVMDAVGEVEIRSQDGPAQALEAGDVIARGQTLRTGGDDSYAAVQLADGTRLLLCPETQVRLSGDDAAHPGQRLVLSTGVLQANVPPLPAERPLTVVTSQAEIEVRETQFTISAPDSSSTAIETESGSARVVRTADGQSTEVPAGFFTVALANERLLPVRQIGQLPAEPRAKLPLERAQALAYRGSQLLVAASHREMATFQLSDLTPLFPPTQQATESYLVLATADGSTLVRSDRQSRFEFLDPLSEAAPFLVETGLRNTPAAAIAPGGELLACAAQIRGRASEVQLWNVPAATKLAALPILGSIRCLAFSADGRRLAVGSVRFGNGVLENWLEIWDHAAERRIVETTVPEQSLRVVALSADGLRVAGATTRGAVHLWNADTGAWLAGRGSADGWAHPVHSLAFSADNQLLAAGTSNGRVRLWDCATNRELGVLACGTRIISALAFSPDGEELAVGAVRGPVLLFRLMETRPASDPL